MIKSFKCRRTEELFETGKQRRFSSIAKQALRKLDMLDAADKLKDLEVPLGNRLEALKSDRQGQHSIRINDQWRICFVWSDDSVCDVEIVDYH